MYNFEEVELESIVVHSAGNQTKGEELRLSKDILKIDEEIVSKLLLKYFVSPFKSEQFFNFHDEEDLANNLVYKWVGDIFEKPGTFLGNSVEIAKFLYEQTTHPNIKGGEFYMIKISNCVVDGEFLDGIGIFKSENKDTYMKVFQRNNNFEVGFEDGININKLDKGCLIFNTEKESGFKVCVVDTAAKNNDAANYWKNDFLNLRERRDNFYRTQNYMSVCKGFVNEVYNEGNDVERTEQIDMMNKTVNYFKDKEVFNEADFEKTVMQEPSVIDAFKDYKRQFLDEHDAEGMSEFGISQGAVKSNQKFFKSVLKLDRNFHLYVHGNREMIESGYDEARRMKFYKLFYLEEK